TQSIAVFPPWSRNVQSASPERTSIPPSPLSPPDQRYVCLAGRSHETMISSITEPSLSSMRRRAPSAGAAPSAMVALTTPATGPRLRNSRSYVSFEQAKSKTASRGRAISIVADALISITYEGAYLPAGEARDCRKALASVTLISNRSRPATRAAAKSSRQTHSSESTSPATSSASETASRKSVALHVPRFAVATAAVASGALLQKRRRQRGAQAAVPEHPHQAGHARRPNLVASERLGGDDCHAIARRGDLREVDAEIFIAQRRARKWRLANYVVQLGGAAREQVLPVAEEEVERAAAA